MSLNILFVLLIHSMLLVSLVSMEPRGTVINTLALLRRTIKYWRDIYTSYSEEVSLGYCYADHFLTIADSVLMKQNNSTYDLQPPPLPDPEYYDHQDPQDHRYQLPEDATIIYFRSFENCPDCLNAIVKSMFERIKRKILEIFEELHNVMKKRKIKRQGGLSCPCHKLSYSEREFVKNECPPCDDSKETSKLYKDLSTEAQPARYDRSTVSKEYDIERWRKSREMENHADSYAFQVSPSVSLRCRRGRRSSRSHRCRHQQQWQLPYDYGFSLQGKSLTQLRQNGRKMDVLLPSNPAVNGPSSLTRGRPYPQQFIEDRNNETAEKEEEEEEEEKNSILKSSNFSFRLENQGRKSTILLRQQQPQPRGSRDDGNGNILEEILSTLSLQPAFVLLLKVLGTFVHVGRQITETLESNKLLSCTIDYVWSRTVKWIDS